MVTHSFLGPVLTAASVHLDVSIPNFVVQEYSTVDESAASDLFVNSIRRVGGYLPLPETPGLGVKLDDAKIAGAGIIRRDFSHTPLRRDGSVAYSV